MATPLSPTDQLNAQFTRDLYQSAGYVPAKKTPWWLYLLLGAVALAIIGALVWAYRQRQALNKTAHWKRVDGVDNTCGAPCALYQHSGVASYAQCEDLAKANEDTEGVNFFTYNPSTQLCSLSTVPWPNVTTKPAPGLQAGILVPPST